MLLSCSEETPEQVVELCRKMAEVKENKDKGSNLRIEVGVSRWYEFKEGHYMVYLVKTYTRRSGIREEGSVYPWVCHLDEDDYVSLKMPDYE